MKKIMFKDRYGLTKAVLEGRKTMTRRVEVKLIDGDKISEWGIDKKGRAYISNYLDADHTLDYYPMYQVGEVAAIAQSYKDAGWNADILQEVYVKKPTLFPELDPIEKMSGWIDLPLKYHKGWNNKMFVLPDLMPHHIKIINIKVERLQDISDKDCLREGIDKAYLGYYVNGLRTRDWEKESHVEKDGKTYKLFPSPQDAFAALIDKVSGKGTWEKNPWVFAYSFERID